MQGRIKHLRNARHRSMHWMMKEAIRQFVEREEQWEAYQSMCHDTFFIVYNASWPWWSAMRLVIIILMVFGQRIEV